MAAGVLARRALSVLILGLSSGSCDFVEGPSGAAVNVTVEAEVRERSFVRLFVAVENTGVESLFYSPCGDVLSRAEGSEWRGVWSRICLLVDIPETEIPPGEQLDLEWNVSPRGSGSFGWQEPVVGTYRVGILALRSSRGDLPDSLGLSEPFEIHVH